jgi:transcriptional regulator GlxA family with amidase domain
MIRPYPRVRKVVYPRKWAMSRHVVFVAFPGVQLIDITGPTDVFDAAGRIAGDPYRVSVVSAEGGPVTSGSGVELTTRPAHLAVAGRIDTLVVPGRLDVEALLEDTRLHATVDALAPAARRVVSVCSGAFVLAAHGLLDGRRVTTHWSVSARLQQLFPEVVVEADRIFIRDGDVATSGGVASGMDLALELVAEDHGRDVARQVAKWLVIYLQRPGGQSQFGAYARVAAVGHPPIRAALDLIAIDPAADHSIERLAAQIGISRRHFARLFRRETGTTPARHVEAVRLELARALLETTADDHDTIARRCGFASGEALRQSFRRTYGVSPRDHRLAFGPAA